MFLYRTIFDILLETSLYFLIFAPRKYDLRHRKVKNLNLYLFVVFLKKKICKTLIQKNILGIFKYQTDQFKYRVGEHKF